MALFASQPPRKRPDQSWDYVRLEPGKSWKGWCAGPTVTIYCHSTQRLTKACRQVFTNGDLSCPYCADGIEPELKCYVPLWSETGLRHAVIVGHRYSELAESVRLLQPVRVTKLVARGTPIRVEPYPWTTLPPPIEPYLQRAQDITPWMLKVWKDEAIKTWVAEHPMKDKATAKVASKIKWPGKDQEPLGRAAPGRRGSDEEMSVAADIEDTMKSLKKKAAKLLSNNNGVHPEV